MNWKVLLLCDVDAGVVGTFSDTLDRHLLLGDCNVVAFSHPLFSRSPKPVRITIMTSFVMVDFFRTFFNSHHLRVTERHHSLRVVNVALVFCSLFELPISTGSSHCSSSTCTCHVSSLRSLILAPWRAQLS